MNNTTFDYFNLSASSQPATFNETLNVITLILGLSAIAANCMLLHLIRINPVLRKDAKRMQLALAVADLILGIGAVVLTVDGWRIRYLSKWYTAYYCIFIGLTKLFGDSLSLTITLAMSFERFVAIAFPMNYRSMNKNKFSSIMIILSFALCLVFAGVGFCGIDGTKKPNSCGGSAVRIEALKPMLSYFNCAVGSAVVLMYFAIVLIIRHKSAALVMSWRKMGDNANEEVFKKEVEATRVVCVIVLGCIAFYVLPNIMITILTAAGLNISFGSATLGTYVSGFSLCNATVNFFLYLWKDPKIRKAFQSWRKNEEAAFTSSFTTKSESTTEHHEMTGWNSATVLHHPNKISDICPAID